MEENLTKVDTDIDEAGRNMIVGKRIFYANQIIFSIHKTDPIILGFLAKTSNGISVDCEAIALPSNQAKQLKDYLNKVLEEGKTT